MKFLLLNSILRFSILIAGALVIHVQCYTQCQLSTEAGTSCFELGIVHTTPGATYTAMASSGKKVGSGQGNGGSISLMFMSNGDPLRIIAKKDDCIAISDNTVSGVMTNIFPQNIRVSGSVCNGTGVMVSLDNSQPQVSYELVLGSSVQTVQGTGGPISFNRVFSSGTYQVNARAPGCIQAFLGMAVIVVGDATIPSPLPYSEEFNTSNDTTLPGCWTKQNVIGTNSLSFTSSSMNPTTPAYDGSRYAFWNSHSIAPGNQTRLISPPIATSNYGTVNVEFQWYNNNNPLFSAGNYLNEGVQVQYSLNGTTWLDAGPLIPRHDPSLPTGTGAWKMKTVTLPYFACRQSKVYISLKFRSEGGDNCSLDNLNIKANTGCVFDIPNAPLISECQTINTYGTQNFSNFIGAYPNNSVGFDAIGDESIFRFIPTSTGIYFIDGIAENSAQNTGTAVFIKQASEGCSLLGWQGVSNNNMPGKRALGMLQAGVEYYILIDGPATFKICKTATGNPMPNTCVTAIPFAGRIPAGSTKKEYLLDFSGNLLAEFDFSNVTSSVDVLQGSYYINNGPIRKDNSGKEYLDRNFSLKFGASGSVRIRLYFSANELQKLIDEPNDGVADVNSLADLKITRTLQSCGPVDAGGTSTLIIPTQVGSIDGNLYYIEFIETLFGQGFNQKSYFIHGGSQALNAQCQAPVTLSLSPSCQGSFVDLSTTETGSTYSFVRKADSLTMGTLQGNGSGQSFPQLVSTNDIYFLKVEKAGCPSAIMEQKYYEVNYSVLQQTLVGGGILCDGVSERMLSLANTEPGVNYTLYRNDVTALITVQGTGSAIQLGKITQNGIYTVKGRKPSIFCSDVVVASLNVSTALQYPFQESFNSSTDQVSSTCWSKQFVVGNSEISLETQCPTPFTNPFDGFRMVTWKSYDQTHPAGNETRLVSPPIQINSAGNLDLEFYWYNNNNPNYSSGNFLNEGVEIQYSIDGINWTSFGSFFPRHDNSLAPGTGKWNKKKVSMPAAFGSQSVAYIGFKFHSEYGDNCNLDLVSLIARSTCQSITALDTTYTTANKIAFQWNSVPGSVGYEYIVTSNPLPPPQGIPTPLNTGAAQNLNSETNYFIHVRNQCSLGIFSNWQTLQVTTKPGPINCEAAETISLCTPVTMSISAGDGLMNFAGLYPLNSVGFPTPGKEKIYSFTPTASGVYYLDVISGNTYVDYFYKPASEGCGSTGWIGIDDFIGNWRKAIGYLQANKTYLILADNEETNATTQQFKICQATLADPITFNNCNGVYWFSGSVPANSPKEEYVIDDQGNLLAALDFSAVSNAVGDMTIYYRVNSFEIRRDTRNREYLDRDFRIYSTNKPNGLVKVKLFFNVNELNKLANEPNDGIADVGGIADLNVSILDQDCSYSASKQGQLSGQTGNGSIFSMSYIQFNTPVLGAFYLHGGNEGLNQPIGINTVCAGTGTSFVMQYYESAATFQWEVDNGMGYKAISNSGIYSGANSKTLFILNPPSEYNNYNYRCIVSSSSGVTIGPVQTLKTVSTWKGTHAFWEDPNNWSCGVVPDENTNVVIPAGVTTMPLLSSNTSVRSIVIQPGASLTVQPGIKLDIKGK